MLPAMEHALRLVVVALLLLGGTAVRADQWGSIVIAHCDPLRGPANNAHLSVRVFWADIGGTDFIPPVGATEGVLSLHDLNRSPVTCTIHGRTIRFETLDYSERRLRGACAQCEQTGFRLTVDDHVVWQIAAPDRRGEPIFNGTLDVGLDGVQICTEHRPEDLSIDLPYKPDFFTTRTSILICETLAY